MRKLKILAIMTAVILIIVILVGLGLTGRSALAATNTIEYYWEWFDLETGTVIPADEMYYPPTNECDFTFGYWGGQVPPSVLIKNTIQGVAIAYSEEDYDNVWLDDVANLSFITGEIFLPFNKVAVLYTPEGNYFKVGFVSESGATVTFQWDQLVLPPVTLDSFFDVFTEFMDNGSPYFIDSFFDVFYEIDGLKSEHSAIVQQLENLNTDHGDIVDQIDDLNSRMVQLEAKMDTLIELIEDLPMNRGQGNPGGPKP